jgi:hypothetical protein
MQADSRDDCEVRCSHCVVEGLPSRRQQYTTAAASAANLKRTPSAQVPAPGPSPISMLSAVIYAYFLPLLFLLLTVAAWCLQLRVLSCDMLLHFTELLLSLLLLPPAVQLVCWLHRDAPRFRLYACPLACHPSDAGP